MFHLSDVLLLQPNERVKTIARAHVITLVPSLAFAFLLIVLPFFFLFPLFRLGIGGVLLFVIFVLLGSIVACRKFLLWDADVFILTSLRVAKVDQRGLLTRIVSEALLSSIQDVLWSRRGFFESVFRMGSMTIQLTNGTTMLEARHIPHPDVLHVTLVGLVQEQKGIRNTEQGAAKNTEERVSMRLTTIENEDRLSRIMTLLKTFSEGELARIETILNERSKPS